MQGQVTRVPSYGRYRRGMLVAAALIPDTALLVEGAAGRADPVAGLRRAALSAIAQVVDARPDVVVVVAPGLADRIVGGTVAGSLSAAGIPDALLGRPPREFTLQDDTRDAAQPGVAAAVALHLLDQVGTDAALRVVEVTPAPGAVALARLGGSLTDGDGRTGLVVVGSGSGRHGPDAPLADDDRAPAYDAAVLADLADAGPEAQARMSAADPALATALAVRGWAPWQVLLGAAGDRPVQGRLLADEVVLGAQHAVLVWTVPA